MATERIAFISALGTGILFSALLVAVPVAALDAAEHRPDLPDNVKIIAEVDGCRTYRVEDTTDQPKSQPKIAFMNHTVYFTKCGNLAVPTTAPVQQ